ncbi:ubiquinone biosynthesis accessory factor UbiJ [Vibrio comitans]|uniref:Ubiquinone biosynthesis accessory factor UbiJ n=1 Tax=Vibrio comitans NBRC 102076 TaxID=1219078 RepID=A0A4Y3IPN5_9VIBR|nr:SCP2 sterol-binding domain-containing protein [Vibrio comitans]GEA61326.1 SCP2 domain-containing protein [Vibrio comitans NBRC 102076]
MPIDALVTAAVETSFNALIKEQPESQKQLARLKGSIIRLNIKELNKSLIFVCSQQVDVLAEFEGTPDCELTLSLTALRDLQQQANINDLFKKDKLSVAGDMQVGQQFATLMQLSKPDVAEILSKVVGDVAAHTLVTGAKNGLSFFQRNARKHTTHLKHAITEEWQLAPSPLAVANFCDQVDDAKAQLHSLEQRLSRLMETE